MWRRLWCQNGRCYHTIGVEGHGRRRGASKVSLHARWLLCTGFCDSVFTVVAHVAFCFACYSLLNIGPRPTFGQVLPHPARVGRIWAIARSRASGVINRAGLGQVGQDRADLGRTLPEPVEHGQNGRGHVSGACAACVRHVSGTCAARVRRVCGMCAALDRNEHEGGGHLHCRAMAEIHAGCLRETPEPRPRRPCARAAARIARKPLRQRELLSARALGVATPTGSSALATPNGDQRASDLAKRRAPTRLAGAPRVTPSPRFGTGPRGSTMPPSARAAPLAAARAGPPSRIARHPRCCDLRGAGGARRRERRGERPLGDGGGDWACRPLFPGT